MPLVNRAPVRRLERRGPGRPAKIRGGEAEAWLLEALAAGWTFAEVARRLKCSPSTVARWVARAEQQVS